MLLLCSPAVRGWQAARVQPRVDNLATLLEGCEHRRLAALERNRRVDAWVAHVAALGEPPGAADARVPIPECASEALLARLGSMQPAVWAIAPAVGGDLLFATVNLPFASVLVSTDGGSSWHYRHLFVRGHNVDRAIVLRGVDFRHGLLAVASDRGILLSTDGGHSFATALPGLSFWAVAISPFDADWIVAGGDGTSFLSHDGGRTWTDLSLGAFIRRLPTRNRMVTDHITSLEYDPADPYTLYAGTGSHLYRFVAGRSAVGVGRWQAMEGDRQGRVLDDSTVYNVEIGSRFMISTCNGVYYLARQGPDDGTVHGDVSWGKFRDRSFTRPGLGGPKGNLRSYFVAEDPTDPRRILVADFAALYEGRSEPGGLRWSRVDELPSYSPASGYPEYTAIAWTSDGGAVVGSRYRGLFVQRPERASPLEPAHASCVLR